MAAYLREIHIPRCRSMMCDKRATHELYNTHNSLIGAFCRRHANLELRAFRLRAGEPQPTKVDLA